MQRVVLTRASRWGSHFTWHHIDSDGAAGGPVHGVVLFILFVILLVMEQIRAVGAWEELMRGFPAVQVQQLKDGKHGLEEQIAEAQGRISELRDQLEKTHAAAAEERQRAQQDISALHGDLNNIAEERYQLQARNCRTGSVRLLLGEGLCACGRPALAPADEAKQTHDDMSLDKRSVLDDCQAFRYSQDTPLQ